MILVLLGTQDKQFNRILETVSNLKKEGFIKDKIIAQTGTTKCNYDNIESFDFLGQDEFEELIKKSKYIITHAGVGSITKCLEYDKKVIVIPRLKKYKEHTNNHQIQITKEFSNKGYVIPLFDEKKLKDKINELKSFKPLKYESNNEKFKEMIKNYINNI